jgi:hypothetical protein
MPILVGLCLLIAAPIVLVALLGTKVKRDRRPIGEDE